MINSSRGSSPSCITRAATSPWTEEKVRSRATYPPPHTHPTPPSRAFFQPLMEERANLQFTNTKHTHIHSAHYFVWWYIYLCLLAGDAASYNIDFVFFWWFLCSVHFSRCYFGFIFIPFPFIFVSNKQRSSLFFAFCVCVCGGGEYSSKDYTLTYV